MTSEDGNGTAPDFDTAVRSTRPPQSALKLMVPRSPKAATIARAALTEWLATWRCPSDLAADVTLVLSELVTNAVIHANSSADITATLHDHRLRVEVHDRSAEPPHLRTGHDDPGGYGLQFVATLADTWGWTFTTPGKVVWTEHRRHDPITPNTSPAALSQ